MSSADRHSREPVDEPRPKLKGGIFLQQLSVIEDRYGREVIERAKARMSEQEQSEINDALPVSWMNVPTVTRLKTLIADEIGRDHLELQREVVRVAISETINKFWRILLSNVWDSALMKRTPVLYSKTFDRGRMRAERIENGEGLMILEGWPDVPDYDCLGLATGIEAVLEYTGRKDAKVRWERHPPEIHFIATWTPKGG